VYYNATKQPAAAAAAVAAVVDAPAQQPAGTGQTAAAPSTGSRPLVLKVAAALPSCDLCCDTCDRWYTTTQVGLTVAEAEALQE
jgi:hypothetical protein